MSRVESVGSVSTQPRMNNLENNAQSSIRRSGKKAGLTGKKLAVFVAAITSTILAMNAPTLAIGIKTQRAKFARNAKLANSLIQLENMKLNIQQREAMTQLREYALNTNKRANAQTFKELNQAREMNKVTKNLASKASAANAYRQLMNLPMKTVSTVTGVSGNVLNVVSKTSSNTKRTAGAVTETVATGVENVGKTTRIVTGSMKDTAEFLGPFSFAAIMTTIMANQRVSAAVIGTIITMLSGMMRKGIPMTKGVLVKIFNMLYSETVRTNAPTPPSNRVVNVTNNNGNRRSPRRANTN